MAQSERWNGANDEMEQAMDVTEQVLYGMEQLDGASEQLDGASNAGWDGTMGRSEQWDRTSKQ